MYSIKTGMLALATCVGATSALAQAPAASNRAGDDPRYESVIATCRNPPPPPNNAGAAARDDAFQAEGNTVDAPYAVTAIPGVIAAGARWTPIWETDGNNADGIMGTADGGILVAQNDKSQVVHLDAQGKESVAYKDTNTGGSVAQSKKGQLFVAQRGLNPAIMQLAPERKVLADRFQGEPLDCFSRRGISDLTADAKGGVYFTMTDLYYASPRGEITRYGQNLRTNGIILSADERTLYVTNNGTLVAFDVQPDGSLTNQRDFATLVGSFGDGGAIDSEGRIYTTGGSGVDVIAADGKHLGVIAAPRHLVSIAFGGPDKKTLYAVASIRPREGGYDAMVLRIPMLAAGYKGRAK